MLAENGAISSKRCIASSGMATLIFLTIHSQLTGKLIDHHIFDMLVFTVLGAAGITAFEKVKGYVAPGGIKPGEINFATLSPGQQADLKKVVETTVAAPALLLIGCLFLFSTSCRPTKALVKEEIHTVDSTRSDSVLQVTNVDSCSRDKETKDTTVGVRGGNASVTLDSADADKDTTVRDGNVELHLYTGKDGKRRATCKADSLTLVIKNLTRENTYLRQSRDSSRSTSTTHQVTEKTLEQVFVEQNKGFFAQVKGFIKVSIDYLIAMVFGALLWEIIKRFGAYQKLKNWYGRF